MCYSIKKSTNSGLWYVMQNEDIIWVTMFKNLALTYCKRQTKKSNEIFIIKSNESRAKIEKISKLAHID